MGHAKQYLSERSAARDSGAGAISSTVVRRPADVRARVQHPTTTRGLQDAT
jgi:hypothetical protein